MNESNLRTATLFPDNLPIKYSKNSIFSSGVFDWNDDNNERLSSISKGELLIDWRKISLENTEIYKVYYQQKYIVKLPKEIIEDLKVFTVLLLAYPSEFNSSKKVIKPRTIVKIIRILTLFIYNIYLNSDKTIKYLSDINIHDIQQGLDTFKCSESGVKEYLKFLTKNVVSENLIYGKVNFTKTQLSTVSWSRKRKKKNNDLISDNLFKFLSTTSINIVSNFLSCLNIDRNDTTIKKESLDFIDRYPDFQNMLSDYIFQRCNRSEVTRISRKFKNSYSMSLSSFSDLLADIHTSAMIVVQMYTGMRYSEVSLIKTKCIFYDNNNFSFIKSTVIKGKSTSMPIDLDRWLAIPIVVDSINVLEKFSEITQNKYLFSGFRNTYTVSRPISKGALNLRLKEYLKKFDVDNKFKKFSLHNKLFRHALVTKLSETDIGLPYVTMHLKHCYQMFSSVPNQTTLEYGNWIPNLLGKTVLKKYIESKLVNPKEIDNLEQDEYFLGTALDDNETRSLKNLISEKGFFPIQTNISFCTKNWLDSNSLNDTSARCLEDKNLNSLLTDIIKFLEIKMNNKNTHNYLTSKISETLKSIKEL